MSYITNHYAFLGSKAVRQGALEKVGIGFAYKCRRAARRVLQALDKAAWSQRQPIRAFIILALMHCHELVHFILQQHTVRKEGNT